MKKWVGVLLLISIIPFYAFAQQTVISGVVRDGKTKKRLPFVNIFFADTQVGVTSDLKGRYSIETDQPYTHLQFSYIGYKSSKKVLQQGVDQVIHIGLQPDTKLLKEIVVKSGKIKESYRNKGNPAVALIRNIIANRTKNYAEHYDYLEYEEYEKLDMSLSTKISGIKKSKFYKKHPFLTQNRDTTTLEGFSLLPIYMQETLSKNYFRQDPQKKWKKIITAHKKTKFDDFFDTNGIGDYLDQLYQNIDIYDADIALLGHRFLSPISDMSPTFYKFYLADTVEVDGERLYELLFIPRNNTDFLFQGSLYITIDDRYAVQHVNMMVNKNINLNWVRSLRVIQMFKKNVDDRYYLMEGTVAINFSVTGQSGGFYGERTVSIKDFITDHPRLDSVYEGERVEDVSVEEEEEEFWTQHRHDTLSALEVTAYAVAESIQKIPAFRRAAKTAVLLMSGYREFRFWELGPLGTFIGGNPIEGFRLGVGGRTMPALNKHMYVTSHVSYGFGDTRWKYYLEGIYSFSGKAPTIFPIRTLALSYQRTMKPPGQELEFVQEDNFLLSVRRGKNDKWVYNDIWNINYMHELKNHFSFRVGLRHLIQEPTGSIYFVTAEQPNKTIPIIKTFETALEIRWAPKEEFFQGKKYRSTIRSKYPIIKARWVSGIKGVLDGEYDYHNLSFIFQKRFYLSQIGFTDMSLEGGYIFGKIPFPLLKIHRANQTYSYQLKSYNLMNFLEFVSDQYVSLQVVHHFNGFFLNKIPILKKLKLREILSFKMLYGKVRNENIPSNDNSLFTFIEETYTFDKLPYMEISLGVENILNFFRIDLVRRLSYLNHPNVVKWGVRGKIRFHF